MKVFFPRMIDYDSICASCSKPGRRGLSDPTTTEIKSYISLYPLFYRSLYPSSYQPFCLISLVLSYSVSSSILIILHSVLSYPSLYLIQSLFFLFSVTRPYQQDVYHLLWHYLSPAPHTTRCIGAGSHGTRPLPPFLPHRAQTILCCATLRYPLHNNTPTEGCIGRDLGPSLLPVTRDLGPFLLHVTRDLGPSRLPELGIIAEDFLHWLSHSNTEHWTPPLSSAYSLF